MMKVYCLFQTYPYEGVELLGVFSSQEKAEKAKEDYLKKWKFEKEELLDIEEYTLDELEQ